MKRECKHALANLGPLLVRKMETHHHKFWKHHTNTYYNATNIRLGARDNISLVSKSIQGFTLKGTEKFKMV